MARMAFGHVDSCGRCRNEVAHDVDLARYVVMRSNDDRAARWIDKDIVRYAQRALALQQSLPRVGVEHVLHYFVVIPAAGSSHGKGARSADQVARIRDADGVRAGSCSKYRHTTVPRPLDDDRGVHRSPDTAQALAVGVYPGFQAQPVTGGQSLHDVEIALGTGDVGLGG